MIGGQGILQELPGGAILIPAGIQHGTLTCLLPFISAARGPPLDENLRAIVGVN